MNASERHPEKKPLKKNLCDLRDLWTNPEKEPRMNAPGATGGRVRGILSSTYRIFSVLLAVLAVQFSHQSAL